MLHQHIIRGLLILFIGTLLLSGIVSYFTIKSNDMERYQASLESHIKIIQYQLPQVKDREAFAKVIKESTGIRFTLINESGVVLVDSDKDNETMDNHARREEIIMAQKMEFAHAVRFSDSVKSNFLYVAHRFKQDDHFLFIRLATNIDTIMHNFYDLWIKLTIIFSLSILAGLYGAYVFIFFFNFTFFH
jgi:hypothetical protein